MEIHRQCPELRRLACLEGDHDVVVSIPAVYPEFSFLPNLDLSAALLIFYSG